MALLIFHLVFSSFTFEGVDMSMAEKIISYNIERYPNGVFFLFGQGRLKLCRSQPSEALQYYQKATEVQNQYRNLHHISTWEMAVANLALWDIPASLECWRLLHAEATVRCVSSAEKSSSADGLRCNQCSGQRRPTHMAWLFAC